MKPSNVISDITTFKTFEKTQNLSFQTIQNVDFINYEVNWKDFIFHETSFLGCKFLKQDFITIIEKGGFVYPKFTELPYKPYREKLYHWKELMNGFSEEKDESIDYKIYQNFVKYKFNPPMHQALAQRIHDNSIDNALRHLVGYDEKGEMQKKAVGFMGGHSMERGDEFYTKTAITAQLVAKSGYYVVTGGGPGIMEAANLGAYMAEYKLEELLEVIEELKKAPHFTSEGYIKAAEKVLEKYPKGTDNLAIPTWFYGHEPSNLFATDIAKYFSNSIREDTLLAISLYGVVFAPGSAGTTQEIFQEAAQNHYGTYGYYSPMIFLSKKRYLEESSLYSTIHQLAQGKKYKDLLYVTDSPQLVLKHIQAHPPIKAE